MNIVMKQNGKTVIGVDEVRCRASSETSPSRSQKRDVNNDRETLAYHVNLVPTEDMAKAIEYVTRARRAKK